MSFGIIASVGFGASAATATAIGATTLGVASTLKAGSDAKKGAQAAADAQTAAGDQIYKQWKEFEARADPYATGGLPAYEQQQALSGAQGAEAQQAAYDQYVESPGVAFMRERGLRGIDRNAAARGGNDLFGGNVEKAKIDYSQGLALQDFNNYWNRLGSVTNTGLAATQAIGGVGSQAASGQAQLTAGAGQSLAQGRIASGQAYQSGFQNLGTAAGNIYEQWQNRKQG